MYQARTLKIYEIYHKFYILLENSGPVHIFPCFVELKRYEIQYVLNKCLEHWN